MPPRRRSPFPRPRGAGRIRPRGPAIPWAPRDRPGRSSAPYRARSPRTCRNRIEPSFSHRRQPAPGHRHKLRAADDTGRLRVSHEAAPVREASSLDSCWPVMPLFMELVTRTRPVEVVKIISKTLLSSRSRRSTLNGATGVIANRPPSCGSRVRSSSGAASIDAGHHQSIEPSDSTRATLRPARSAT